MPHVAGTGSTGARSAVLAVLTDHLGGVSDGCSTDCKSVDTGVRFPPLPPTATQWSRALLHQTVVVRYVPGRQGRMVRVIERRIAVDILKWGNW